MTDESKNQTKDEEPLTLSARVWRALGAWTSTIARRDAELTPPQEVVDLLTEQELTERRYARVRESAMRPIYSGVLYPAVTVRRDVDLDAVVDAAIDEDAAFAATGKRRVDERALYATDNADVWAREFAKVCPDVDEGLMVGWFANCSENAKTLQRAREPSSFDTVGDVIEIYSEGDEAFATVRLGERRPALGRLYGEMLLVETKKEPTA